MEEKTEETPAPVPAPLPTTIEEVDALRLENVSLELDLLNAQGQRLQMLIEAAHARGNTLGAELRTKYQITDADTLNIKQRRIERK